MTPFTVHRSPFAPLDKLAWLAALALLLFLALIGNVVRGIESASGRRDPVQHLRVNLRDCTPPDRPVTNEVIFTIRLITDDRAVVLGCTRYAWPIPTERILKSATPENEG